MRKQSKRSSTKKQDRTLCFTALINRDSGSRLHKREVAVRTQGNRTDRRATAHTSATDPLPIWGGIECTINRVGDRFHDQFARSGHGARPGDFERIRDLGIKILRYPAHWERVVRAVGTRPDWTWCDQQFGRLKELNMRPIVGFLHHGSGPVGTDLLDESMPQAFAQYAADFARRFPWIQHYNPVNEPLTTARFSALYGHWYPHRRDDRSFATACLNQYRAIVLAMQAIRAARSDAQLIQTEDLGKTFSSPSLKYQADFENARRWLTFDLLTGQVAQHHPMGDYFRWLGISDDLLKWFLANPCPPNVLGINYYVTSERYLDRRVWKYPPTCRGRNDRHTYADVAAVRVRADGLMGIRKLILETWKRFHIPIAVTEAHLGCAREDQLRWLHDIWRETTAARTAGARVEAMTVWSLLGAFDWDSLVTQDQGHYEQGAFDIRGAAPRKTAIADLVTELTRGDVPTHPVISAPGWWHRPERRLWNNDSRRASNGKQTRPGITVHQAPPRPILIVTNRDGLGKTFKRICTQRGLECYILTQPRTDSTTVLKSFENARPWAVINTASYPSVDKAEREREQCARLNVEWPVELARLCRDAKVPFATFSSDHVFDGEQRAPYKESDPINPLGIYGHSKAECEKRVLEAYPGALIVRSSECFGPDDHNGTVARCHSRLLKQLDCRVPPGIISLTYMPDLVHVCLALRVDRASGLWHVSADGEISWTELIEELARRAGINRNDVRMRVDLGLPAPRPYYRTLCSERGARLPDWRNSLDRYFRESIRLC